MIRLTDALTLAFTKLRTRKIRTILTIVIAALLFSGVFVILFVSQGFFQGAEKFSKESFAGRFIITGSDMNYAYADQTALMMDPTLIKKAEDKRAQLIADKKREAARLGIDYDPSTEPQVTSIYDPTTNQKGLSYDSSIAQAVLSEATGGSHKSLTFDDFKAQAAAYHPSAYYATQTMIAKNGSIQEMKNGKEDLSQSTSSAKNTMAQSSVSDDIQTATLAPDALVKLYMIPDHGWTPSSATVPVLVIQRRAAKLVNFPEPARSASAHERLTYMQQLREKAKGATFSVCYRNTVSQQHIIAAQQVAKEIAAHKNDATYQKPSLIYGLPDPTSCAAAPVVSDTRSFDEKQLTAKQEEFAQIFGEITTSIEHKITFQVVGILPNSTMDAVDGGFLPGIDQMLSLALASQTFRFAVPSELYQQIPDKTAYADALNVASDGTAQTMVTWGLGQYYAEFPDATSARQFTSKESCQFDMTGTCNPTSKFMLSSFGSNSIGLDEAKKVVMNIVFWLTVVVSALAALIAGLTIGRTIADGRRETAVFRAIGFKRLDISSVYSMYTFLLCTCIALVAVLLGYLVAALIDSRLWVSATVQAQIMLGISNTSTQFHFLGVSIESLWVIAAVFVSGIAGMITPLIRNVRRNPIRDMRDE